jgi:tetratricopeptide (TPR) repeat protein
VAESVRIFLSTVSDEFGDYRDQLRSKLTRHNVEVKIQEDFKDFGTTTLEKLDDYIKLCGAVVHLVGDMTGAAAGEFTTKAILARYSDLTQKFPPLREALANGEPISYTQWEAWLALYHGKVLLIAKADNAAPRGPKYASTDASRAAQQTHLERLRVVGHYPGNTFAGLDNLAYEIFSTPILELLAKALALDYLGTPPPQPNNIPFASLGALFKGRDGFLRTLHTALASTGDGTAMAVTGKALHGLGGVGKTRLAVEYALRHRPNYSALLFVRAETPERLAAGLAALAAADALNLPEKEAREDTAKIAAVLAWLERHPLWFMILDNVDEREAAVAVERLMPKLFGGRLLITGRLTSTSAAVSTLTLDVLTIEDATDFLLERTEGGRIETPQDRSLAQELAKELGGLALGLEQAGAYIRENSISFADYLQSWHAKADEVWSWFDQDFMTHHHSLATTWATSVEKLTPAGRRLLELCAFLAPEPIPETLLNVAVPGGDMGFEARKAMLELFRYSLASRVAVVGQEGKRALSIHRLVQEFTRRRLDTAKSGGVLSEALGWVNVAFVGDPSDVRNWPTLDPLAPHALALAKRAAEAGVPEPTARLMGELGLLFKTKARHVEAEPLYRRALAIDEASLGPEHPNLAALLRATNRLAEAEPMYRRALDIDEKSFGPDHPNVARDLSNLAQLLQDTNRLAEAEPLIRRALAIDEKSFGPEHPNVAIRLNNLAALLQATDRLAEAEPMYRRALAIDEKSFGPEHPNVARDLNNLATLLKATNRIAEAEPLMRRVVEILLSFTARTGHEHPHLQAAFRNYFGLLRAMGRSEAEARAEIEALIRAHGPQS